MLLDGDIWGHIRRTQGEALGVFFRASCSLIKIKSKLKHLKNKENIISCYSRSRQRCSGSDCSDNISGSYLIRICPQNPA